MKAVLGQDIGHEMVALLGLPPNCKSFKINVTVDELVTIECEFIADGPLVSELVKAFALYELHEKKG